MGNNKKYKRNRGTIHNFLNSLLSLKLEMFLRHASKPKFSLWNGTDRLSEESISASESFQCLQWDYGTVEKENSDRWWSCDDLSVKTDWHRQTNTCLCNQRMTWAHQTVTQHHQNLCALSFKAGIYSSAVIQKPNVFKDRAWSYITQGERNKPHITKKTEN